MLSLFIFIDGNGDGDGVEMVKRDLPGYAIGGLSGGEAKDSFWKVVRVCTALLPPDKPRYLMGVGYETSFILSRLHRHFKKIIS